MDSIYKIYLNFITFKEKDDQKSQAPRFFYIICDHPIFKNIFQTDSAHKFIKQTAFIVSAQKFFFKLYAYCYTFSNVDPLVRKL